VGLTDRPGDTDGGDRLPPPIASAVAAGGSLPPAPPHRYELNRALLMGSLRAPPAPAPLVGSARVLFGSGLRCASARVLKPRGLTTSSAMKSYRLSELSDAEVSGLKARPRIDFSSIFGTVNPIVEDVRIRGDAAVKDYTEKFDKVTLDDVVVRVSDLPDAELDPAVKEAFDVAYDNIYAFHVSQKLPEKTVENMRGVRCKRITRCISSVGLYVPGGTAVLPSTALMLAVVCLPLPNSLNLTDCNDSLFKTSQLVSLSASLHRLLDAKLLFLPHPLVVMVAYARYTFGT